MSTNTARITALESDVAEIKTGIAALLALHNPAQPAVEREVQPKADNEFVTWLKDTAEARAERKATNKELAAACRKVGVNPAGTAWAYAKAQTAAGKAINVRTLKAKGAADKKAA